MTSLPALKEYTSNRFVSHMRTGILLCVSVLPFVACAQGNVPQTRNVDIPPPQKASARQEGINEHPDSVMYLPLGRDVLVPEVQAITLLPDKQVGPFELRGETLGGALQLILADVDIPMAFQTDLGLSRTVTITNLKGNLPDVVDQVCALADLYCAFEKGTLVVKERQTFTVMVPPIGTTEDRQAMMTSMSAAIQAITARAPITDPSSRTIIYEATNRTSDQVARYFQRLRASTSLVVFETYVWEVSLNSNNANGIRWSQLGTAGIFNMGVTAGTELSETVTGGVAPITIGLPTRGAVNFDTGDVLQFMSSYGAVKTVSQPQITVLSGSTARLRIADTENYVSEVTRTVTGDQTTTSATTDSVDSGFTLEIASGWDNSTVYGNVNIILNELRSIDNFDLGDSGNIQLPKTTEREVETQIRVRPGDSMLIAGLVRESDTFDKSGLGVDKPIIPTGRQVQTGNVELVFLLRPRVIVFTDTDDRYVRADVKSDIPLKASTLKRGDAQTTVVDDSLVGGVPVSVDTNVQQQGAPTDISPVISRLFDRDHPSVSEPVLLPNIPPVTDKKISVPSVPKSADHIVLSPAPKVATVMEFTPAPDKEVSEMGVIVPPLDPVQKNSLPEQLAPTAKDADAMINDILDFSGSVDGGMVADPFPLTPPKTSKDVR